MKIVVIVHDFELGGAERIALRLAAHWAASGNDVTVISGSGEGPQRRFLPKSVKVISPARPIRRGMTRTGLSCFVRQHKECLEGSVILLPGNYYFGIAWAIRRDLPNAVIFGKISNSMSRAGEPAIKGMSRRSLLRLKSRYLDKILVMHDDLVGEVAKSLRLSRDRLEVVGQPVIETTYPLTERMSSGINIVAAGRLTPQKNFDLLIDSIKLIKHDVFLRILGDGPLRQDLENKVKDLGLEKVVHFEGFQDDIYPYLEKADLFILSSDFEGFSSVIVEAFSAGTPVISTDCSPMIRSLISDDRLGRVVEPRNSRAMAKAIDDCLSDRTRDRDFIQKNAEPYRLNIVADRYLSVFEGGSK
ncbi:MAG: glycosyltransferase [Sphingobium sp.]